MLETAKLSCNCGKVTGTLEIHKKDRFHVKCLCCDCQSFAAHLGNEEALLDSSGGTELFQTYPAYVTINEGEEYISCLRLSSKGLLRHYTSCCHTPAGNMLEGPKIPFIGIPVAFMSFESDEHKNRILGPITLKAFGKYAKGEKPDDAYERFPLSFLPKIIAFMIKGWMWKKYQPSPYFRNGEPISPPEVLKKENK